MHVTRDDKNPLRRARQWLSRRVHWARTALTPSWMTMIGFAEFQILVAASSLGLFDLLAKAPGRTADEIQNALQLPDHSAKALLLACTSLGFIVRHSRLHTYRNSWKIGRLFGKERGVTIPHLEAFHHLMYRPFHHLTETLQQGTNVGLQCVPGAGNTLYDRLAYDPESKRIFYAWMKSMKDGRSMPATVVDALRDRRHLLDIGGGDADNALDLVRQLPDLRVTIIDLVDTCDVAMANVAKAGLSERIAVRPGNFLEDPLPQGADAVLFAHIFNIYSDATNQALVKKSADVLPKGGKLIICGLISHDDQKGPWYAGFMSLYFQVLATGVGRVYPPSRYETWFEHAGFASLVMHSAGLEAVFVGTK